ncbi:MAG: FG-GAP-like repeat-containing protein, partial [Bradyrhizobium sp.]
WSVGENGENGGTFTVTFSGAGKGDVSATIEAGSLNAKMDLVNGNEIYANANTTLNEGAAGLRLIGIQNINGTGNNLANVITGNSGANILTGLGGNDVIDGGNGTDTAVFSGKMSDYKIVLNGTSATIEDMRSGSPDGIDTISNIELVNFGGTTVPFSSLKNQIPAVAVAGSVSIADVQVAEGNAGTKTMIFTVLRTGGTAAFDVNFAAADGLAKISDGDYSLAPGTLRFAANETQKTISVTINGDTKFEGDETFSINLSNPSNGATITKASAIGTILNDDAAPVAGSISIADVQIAEGNAGTKTMIFTVLRAGGTAAFDVNFAAVDGTAKVSDGDFSLAPGTLRFAADETQKTISVTINGDVKFEGDETFSINLSNATNGATIADGIAIGTIQNDDANRAPTVTANNVTLAAGASVAVNSIFTGQDLDGNSTITKYAFWDAGNGGGFFTVNGVAQASGQWIQIDAANLGNVRYVGGANGGVETLWATAFDGNSWSVNKSVSATTLQRAPSDFNGDGNSDVLFHNNSGAVAMWQMDGMNKLANVGAGTQATSWHAMDAFDFNGDGKADILWHNDSGQVQLWQMNGAQATQKLDLGSMGTGWHIGGVDDFTGDGKAEVLWHNTSNGQVQMWNMNGASHTTTNVGTIAAGWTIQDTADFNGDGKADLLLRNGSNVAMWQMDGAKVGAQSNYTMGDAFHFAGTGDFNADGKADILWHNDTSGQLVLWEMNGTNILSNTTAGFTAKGWDIAQIGDFNHDGHADLLVQNAATGAMAEWQMDGDHVLAQQSLGSVSTDWHII